MPGKKTGARAAPKKKKRRKPRSGRVFPAAVGVNLIVVAAIAAISAVLYVARPLYLGRDAAPSTRSSQRSVEVAAPATPAPSEPSAAPAPPAGSTSPGPSATPGPPGPPTARHEPAGQALPAETTSPLSVERVVKNAPALRPPVPAIGRPAATAGPASPPPEKPLPVRSRGTLVFVFDDAGHNLTQLKSFLSLPFPCAIAVLPGLQYSGEAARQIRAAGKELLLHQPMQAIDLSRNPGPGAIRKGMNPEEIRSLVRRNIAQVGPVAGINNHEGSLITEDRAAMGAVLDVASESGVYYLDSRTTAKTVVPALARERNMTIWERAIFLDNSPDRASIMEAVSNGMKVAENGGAAIMIGHVWSNELAETLRSMYPELVSEGFSLSTIASIALNGDQD